MPVTESSTFWDKTSKFVATHRSAIAISVAVGVSGVAGAYLYLHNAPATDKAPSKKKKKAKKSAPTVSDGEDKLKESLKDAIFPYDPATLSPKIDDELVANTSAKDAEDYALALKETGNLAFKNKAYQKAIEYYTAALKFKEDPVFYSNRSACYSYLEDHAKVIEDTTRAIKLKPDYSKCLLRRAQSYDTLERYEDAMFDLTAVAIYGGISNKTTDAQLEKILHKHATKVVDSKLVDHKPTLPSTSTISPFFGAFKPEGPIAGLDEAALADGSAEKFLVDAIKNIALNTTEGYEAADVLLKQAADRYGKELTPESPNAQYAAIAFEYLGAFDFLKNNSDLAINNILYAIALNPRPRAHILLALIYADRQELDQSSKQFDVALSMDDSNSDLYYHRGQLFYLSNRMAEAAQNFERAKELSPEIVYPYIQLACIAYREGKQSEAEQKFAETKKKFPTAPEVPNYYGEILSDQQDFDAALKQFDIAARLQAALKTETIGAIALINKATLLARTDPLEANRIFTEAIKIDPKSEIARMALAQVKLQLEETDEAVKLFEEASALSRSYAEKLQATQFAEAAKMQVRLRRDPALSAKVNEIMAQAQAAQAVQAAAGGFQ